MLCTCWAPGDVQGTISRHTALAGFISASLDTELPLHRPLGVYPERRLRRAGPPRTGLDERIPHHPLNDPESPPTRQLLTPHSPSRLSKHFLSTPSWHLDQYQLS